MKETLEYIKVGLLAVIAVGVVYTSFFKAPTRKKKPRPSTAAQTQNTTFNKPSNTVDLEQSDLSVKVDPNTSAGAAHNFNSTSVSWDSDVHDFGNIKQHTENVHVFNFTNTGSTPLVIEDAKGSCGCTIPEYPREPIAPGEKGEILVKYSPGTQIGQQTKTVVITANTEPKVTNLFINAEVEEAPDPAL